MMLVKQFWQDDEERTHFVSKAVKALHVLASRENLIEHLSASGRDPVINKHLVGILSTACRKQIHADCRSETPLIEIGDVILNPECCPDPIAIIQEQRKEISVLALMLLMCSTNMTDAICIEILKAYIHKYKQPKRDVWKLRNYLSRKSFLTSLDYLEGVLAK